jgi:nicotinamidase-related amidase
MLAGPQVFVDVDTQVDFLDPAGALFVPGSTEIVPNLARLTRFAREHGIPILASADAHTPDDPELTSFPSSLHGWRTWPAANRGNSPSVQPDPRRAHPPALDCPLSPDGSQTSV